VVETYKTKEKIMQEIFIENKAISPLECPVFSTKK
jgi:hypothetical protein